MVFKTMSEYQNCSWTRVWKSSKTKDYAAAIQTQPPDFVLYPGPKPRSYYGNPNSLTAVGNRAAACTPQQTGALAPATRVDILGLLLLHIYAAE